MTMFGLRHLNHFFIYLLTWLSLGCQPVCRVCPQLHPGTKAGLSAWGHGRGLRKVPSQHNAQKENFREHPSNGRESVEKGLRGFPPGLQRTE